MLKNEALNAIGYTIKRITHNTIKSLWVHLFFLQNTGNNENTVIRNIFHLYFTVSKF